MGGISCKAKVILNGGGVQDGAARLCYQVEETPPDDLTYDQWIGIVKYLNDAEDSVNKATRASLAAKGFKGPWPKSLS